MVMMVCIIPIFSQSKQRVDLNLPKVEEYMVLAADFHIHTVFSDGNVWPTVRVDEAWKQGLDVISITDHIEYQPHGHHIPTNHNAAYEVAKEHSHQQNIILIKGCEITRDMPPGHLNAIFISDGKKIETERVRHYLETGERPSTPDTADYKLAIEAAYEQDAFIFWNHPGWTAQSAEGAKLWPEHKELIKSGRLMGIEVANWNTWYPEALEWALKYDLTMLSNSDVHEPMEAYLDHTQVSHRPTTLVFVKEKTADGVRKALEDRKTIVWFNNKLVGKKELLEPFFKSAIHVLPPHYTNKQDETWITLKNTTGIQFTFKLEGERNLIKLQPFKSVIVKIEKSQKTIDLDILSLIITPDNNLKTSLKLIH